MKIAKTFLAGVMLSTSISIPAFAQDQANSLPALQVENSLLELVESTTDNSITFKDGSTLIQYDSYYIATDLNGKDELKITKVDETKVKYENLQTGEVNYATNEIKPIHEDLSFSPQALADGYVYKGKVENSTEIIYATASAIAGILASFIGGPVGGRIAGILVSIGGYYLSKDAPRAYWVTKHILEMLGIVILVRHYSSGRTITIINIMIIQVSLKQHRQSRLANLLVVVQ